MPGTQFSKNLFGFAVSLLAVPLMSAALTGCKGFSASTQASAADSSASNQATSASRTPASTPDQAAAAVQAAVATPTVTALRLANTITGGLMPTSDPAFTQIVDKVSTGDIQGAATVAADSPYFAKYLARRLAMQMQNPGLDASSVTDNDATTFLVAHFVGAKDANGNALKPSISTIWSDNSTYLINVTSNGTTTATHTASLSASQMAAVNWMTDLVQTAGQKAKDLNNNTVTIPAADVGGYITLSDRPNDTSFAQYGATAGTNLRMIEGFWEIATGLQLLDVASPDATPQDAPRFVPEYNPNFFQGQGQTACIACHGGGYASIDHGYSTVADIFDFNPKNGFTYIAAPTTKTMKSLGSDPTQRTINQACNLVKTPTAACSPDGSTADPNQAWNLAKTWQATGVLQRMGWNVNAPTSGNGLNQLGAALGKAAIVYQFLTERVIGEICPLGEFTASDIANIAAAADPYASNPGTDDVRTIVALVATNPTCQ